MKLDDIVNIKLDDGKFHKSKIIDIFEGCHPKTDLVSELSSISRIQIYIPDSIIVFCQETNEVYHRSGDRLGFKPADGQYYEIDRS